jgi:hypothetical protein
MQKHEFKDIRDNAEKFDQWYMTELANQKLCYCNSGIVTIWVKQTEGLLRIESKKRVDGNIQKEIHEAEFSCVDGTSVEEEIISYHRFSNNFFDRLLEPVESSGVRGGQTTHYTLKTGERKHRFNVLLNDEIYREILSLAEQNQKTRNQMIVGIIENTLRDCDLSVNL